MSQPFTAQSVTLAELLAPGRRLCIPDYQRAYAWTPAEAGQLLDDALLALDEAGGGVDDTDDDYFLGAVVLMEVDPDDPNHPEEPGPGGHADGRAVFEIVDGLQRIVTLTILFAVARDLTLEIDPETSALAAAAVASEVRAGAGRAPHLELGSDEQAFFDAYVQAPGASSEMPEDDALTEAEQRMLEVREHLAAALLDETPARVAALVRFLRDRCHCAVIATRTIDRAHRIFAVLNDRGRPLARSDILKAQILGHIPADRRTRYRERWTAIERRLGGSLEELLSHIRTIESRSRGRIIDDIRLLVGRSGSAEAFIDGVLGPYGEILAAIRRETRATPAAPAPLAGPDPAPDAATPAETVIARRIGYLGWLGSADWIPPLMLYWRLVDGRADQLEAFLGRLDRLAYCMRFLGLGADKRATRYHAVLEAVRSGALDRPASPLDPSRDEQRLVMYNLRSIHARSQLACKLLLLRINDELAGAPQRLDPSDLTVEHVLPQKPGKASRWREWFPLAEERDRCTQSLGNLILVSRERNERARNLDLDLKLEVYFSDGPDRQPFISRDIEGLAEWRPDDVRRREERLVEAVQRLWQIGPARSGVAPEAPPAEWSPQRRRRGPGRPSRRIGAS